MKLDKKFIGIIVIIVLAISIIFVYSKLGEEETFIEDETELSYKEYNDKKYYIYEEDYDEEYDIKYVDYSDDFQNNKDKYDDFEMHKVLSYDEYEEYCNKWNIKQKYKNENKNYIVFSYLSIGRTYLKAKLGGVVYNNDKVSLYVWDDEDGVVASIVGYVIVIPSDTDLEKVEVIPMYTEEEFNNIRKYGNPNGEENYVAKKPILYFYPEKTTDIKIKLLNENNITTSYPKYDKEWFVRADKEGNLIDLKTNKNLYALYYESKYDNEFKITKEGFIVDKSNIVEFLEEKLTILGLNDKEKEEFIIYWLPILENNKYNYIRFATKEEIDNNIPINIEPNPDTFIRVLMIYKGLDEPLVLKEQELPTTTRTGYTVVEWGGTLIK